MFLHRADDGLRHHRNAVLVYLSLANSDLPAFKVPVLDS